MIQDAIKIAIQKGGYEPSFRITPCEIDGIKVYHNGDTILDPLFWQALGKAKGWVGIHGNPFFMCRNCGKEGGANSIGSCDHCGAHEYGNFKLAWEHHALRYLETLLTEGTEKADEYLSSLLQ